MAESSSNNLLFDETKWFALKHKKRFLRRMLLPEGTFFLFSFYLEPIELLFFNFVLLVLEYQSTFLGVIDGDWLLTTYFFGKNLLTQVV